MGAEEAVVARWQTTWKRRGWLPGPRTAETVLLTTHTVEHRLGDRSSAVSLADVVYLELITTADGPEHDDLYLALVTEAGDSVRIPSAAWKPLGLLDRVAQLDGVLWDALTLASASLVDYRFPFWRGQPGDAVVLGR